MTVVRITEAPLELGSCSPLSMVHGWKSTMRYAPGSRPAERSWTTP